MADTIVAALRAALEASRDANGFTFRDNEMQLDWGAMDCIAAVATGDVGRFDRLVEAVPSVDVGRHLLLAFAGLAWRCVLREGAFREIGLSAAALDAAGGWYLDKYWNALPGIPVVDSIVVLDECLGLLADARCLRPYAVLPWLAFYAGQTPSLMLRGGALRDRVASGAGGPGAVTAAVNELLHRSLGTTSSGVQLKATAFAQYQYFVVRFEGTDAESAYLESMLQSDEAQTWRFDRCDGWKIGPGRPVEESSTALRWAFGQGVPRLFLRRFLGSPVGLRGEETRPTASTLVVSDGMLTTGWMAWMSLNSPVQANRLPVSRLVLGGLNRTTEELEFRSPEPTVDLGGAREILHEFMALSEEETGRPRVRVLSSRAVSLLADLFGGSSGASAAEVFRAVLGEAMSAEPSKGLLESLELLCASPAPNRGENALLAELSPPVVLLEALLRRGDPVARTLVIEAPFVGPDGVPEGFSGGSIQALLGPDAPTGPRAALGYSRLVGSAIAPIVQAILARQLVSARDHYRHEVRARQQLDREIRQQLERFPKELIKLEEMLAPMRRQIEMFHSYLSPALGGIGTFVPELQRLFARDGEKYVLKVPKEGAAQSLQAVAMQASNGSLNGEVLLTQRSSDVDSPQEFTIDALHREPLEEDDANWGRLAIAGYVLAAANQQKLIKALFKRSRSVQQALGVSAVAEAVSAEKMARELAVFRVCKELSFSQWSARRTAPTKDAPWACPLAAILGPFVEFNDVHSGQRIPIRVAATREAPELETGTEDGQVLTPFRRLYDIASGGTASLFRVASKVRVPEVVRALRSLVNVELSPAGRDSGRAYLTGVRLYLSKEPPVQLVVELEFAGGELRAAHLNARGEAGGLSQSVWALAESVGSKVVVQAVNYPTADTLSKYGSIFFYETYPRKDDGGVGGLCVRWPLEKDEVDGG